MMHPDIYTGAGFKIMRGSLKYIFQIHVKPPPPPPPLPYLEGLNKPTNDNNLQIQILSFKNLSVNDASRFIIGFSLVWYSFGYKIN